MFTKIVFLVLLGMTSISFMGCSTEQTLSANRDQEEIVSATVIGSFESPDPILVKVRELEQQGVLNNVVVMESFPVQIRVTGPRSVINDLKSMPRKVSADFK